MDVIILTSSNSGSASVHLQELIKSNFINVKMVVLSEGQVTKTNNFYKKKLSKLIKIGFLGAINGVRMRKWYSEDTDQYTNTKLLQEICSENNIILKKSISINCKQTIDLFKESKAELGVSLGNGYISSRVFSIPRLGMVNVHHEELPKYQNAQSIIWQLYNKSPFMGYTIHRIDKKIDTGEILYKEKKPIIFKHTLADTVSYNYAHLLSCSAIGLLKVLEDYQFYYDKRESQESGKVYTTPTIFQFLKIVKNFKNFKN
jgi:methionyl-tRNA formyltransferase